MSEIRQRPNAVSLTEAAASRFQDIMSSAEESFIGVRIGVKNGGCAGMEYTMDYANEAAPADEIVIDRGIKIFIEAKAVLFLLGSEIDYQVDKLSSKFVFNNPNQVDACGCGESVTIIPRIEVEEKPLN